MKRIKDPIWVIVIWGVATFILGWFYGSRSVVEPLPPNLAHVRECAVSTSLIAHEVEGWSREYAESVFERCLDQ